jgi:hypothetical protein
MKYLESKIVSETVRAQQGKIYSVLFQKKDGTLRKLNTRRGVRKHLAGGKSTLKDRPWIYTAYDIQKDAWRCFNITRVIEIRGRGKVVKA